MAFQYQIGPMRERVVFESRVGVSGGLVGGQPGTGTGGNIWTVGNAYTPPNAWNLSNSTNPSTQTGSDQYGNTETDSWGRGLNIWTVANVWLLPDVWNPTEEEGAVWAYLRPVFGREQVEAGRNESTMLGTLVVRSSPGIRLIDPAYRVRFLNYGPYAKMICNIRSIVPTPDRKYVEFRLEQGVAPE